MLRGEIFDYPSTEILITVIQVFKGSYFDMGATDCPMTQFSHERYNMYSISYELFHHPLNGVQIVFIDDE